MRGPGNSGLGLRVDSRVDLALQCLGVQGSMLCFLYFLWALVGLLPAGMGLGFRGLGFWGSRLFLRADRALEGCCKTFFFNNHTHVVETPNPSTLNPQP